MAWGEKAQTAEDAPNSFEQNAENNVIMTGPNHGKWDLILASKWRRARTLAPVAHAALFASTWAIFGVSDKPLLDGPARVPFAVLYWGDFPFSAVAFGFLFTSNDPVTDACAVGGWLLFGTLMWFGIGLIIDNWKA